MKTFHSLLLFFVLQLFTSCDNDDAQYENILVAVPEVMTKAEFRSSIKVEEPKDVQTPGKIYAYNNLILVSDTGRGVHVIDNSNPENPTAKAFINLKGNFDVAVKNDYLYADSSLDLVVFDLSDINNISKVFILEDIFQNHIYHLPFPEGIQDVNLDNFDSSIQLIVGWSTRVERREVRLIEEDVLAFSNTSAEASVGQGGSLARFQIVDNYLYTVGSFEMAIFNIQNLEQPVLENTQYSGWNIETMFEADDYLYLGSTNGMYIYSLSNPGLPEYVSEITHWEGCDPVVVDGDYAYLTLRGGNLCGQQESELQVINVSDKSNPELVATYSLDNPYGLGYKGDNLFICDGTSGLKLYDKTNPLNLQFKMQFQNVQAKDVIPLEQVLILVGDDVLYQYEYGEDAINLISTFQL